MKLLPIVISATLLLPAFSVFAEQTPDPCPNPGTFGCFEVGIPGITEKSIDTFLDNNKADANGTNGPILAFIRVAVNVIIGILVLIGVISVVIGGYLYMTAGGNGKQVESAKEMILAALMGIVISLVSVVILNTINRFIGSGAREPILSPAPGAGTAGAGESSPQTGGGLPNSANVITTETFDITPQVPVNPQEYALPADNNAALTASRSNIDSVYNDVVKHPSGTTVSSEVMEGYKKRAYIGIEQIQQLRDRPLNEAQVFFNDTSARKFEAVKDRLSSLKVLP
jgi:hypothetical protein